MSMSSPDVQEKPPATEPSAEAVSVRSESWSLLRWLIAAALIVVVGASATAILKMMPTEGLPGEEAKKFLIVAPSDRLPGKATLAEDATFNFGVMAQKQKGAHTWVLKNEGSGDLLLSLGDHDCSCTVANFDDNQPTYNLKAGTQTEVTLSWETRTYDGGLKKHAAINLLNDPDRSSVVFTIEGSVRPAIAVQPAERVQMFAATPNDQPQTTKFAIASADKPDLKILKITTTSPDEVVATAVPLPDADRRGLEWQAMKGGFLINVELKPSKNLGAFQEEIVVTTDHPILPEVTLIVGGKRTGPISLTPDVVRMHQVKSADGAEMTMVIMVRNAPETKFEVVEKPDNLKVEIIPSDVNTGTIAKVRRYKMVVTVPPGTPAGLIDGAITLKSDHPQGRMVKIPVDVVVLGGE
jgi:Protein of unknown function (DUF1573)